MSRTRLRRAARAALLVWSVASAAGAQAGQGGSPEVEKPSARDARGTDLGGSSVDVSAFRHRRAVVHGASGLVALRLDEAVLAGSRGPAARFADLRVVDAEGYQVPYVLRRRDAPLIVDLPMAAASSSLEGLDSAGNRSVHAVTLPYAGLPPMRLAFETSARVFRREVQAGVERPPDRRRRAAWFQVLASGVWQHADEDAPAPPLELTVSPGGAAQLLVLVDEGDNRPLPITRVRAQLPGWEVRFFQGASPVELVYGRDDMAPPEYDLALRADVLSAEAREVLAAPPLPAAPDDEMPRPWWFWTGLAATVLVLLLLIGRLLSLPPTRR